jgi:hypothetical protein
MHVKCPAKEKPFRRNYTKSKNGYHNKTAHTKRKTAENDISEIDMPHRLSTVISLRKVNDYSLYISFDS